MPEQVPTNFSTWAITLIAAILGFLAAIILERFRNRMVFLKYKKNAFQLATSVQNNFWGNIEVLYNNRRTQHLSLLTVEIKNDSNIDLENVNIDYWVDNDSQILAHQSNYVESGNFILLEDNYFKEFNIVVDLNEKDQKLKLEDPNYQTLGLPQRIAWALKNKKFNLPVFNRNTSVRFQILIENFAGQGPLLSLSILHKSCKLVEEADEKIITQTRNKYVGLIWLVLAFFSTLLIYTKFRDNPFATIWAGALSFFSLYIGYTLYQIITLIKRLWR